MPVNSGRSESINRKNSTALQGAAEREPFDQSGVLGRASPNKQREISGCRKSPCSSSLYKRRHCLPSVLPRCHSCGNTTFFQRSCVHHATTTSYTDNITLHGSVWHKNIFICICQLAYSSAQPRFHRNSACFDRKAYGKRLDNDITILSQLVRTRLILDRVNNRITQEVV